MVLEGHTVFMLDRTALIPIQCLCGWYLVVWAYVLATLPCGKDCIMAPLRFPSDAGGVLLCERVCVNMALPQILRFGSSPFVHRYAQFCKAGPSDSVVQFRGAVHVRARIVLGAVGWPWL